MTSTMVDERLWVALAVTDDLHEVLPNPADQIVVIDDLVRRWRALPPADRAQYHARADERFGAVMHYAWAYLAQVDEAAVAAMPPGARADQIDAACLRHWRAHVARLAKTAEPAASPVRGNGHEAIERLAS